MRTWRGNQYWETGKTGIVETLPQALRPAVCLLLAALAARGTSVLRDVYVINRGYEDLANRLNALGANIEVFRDWVLRPEENAGLLLKRREEPADEGKQYVFFISSQHMRKDHGWHLHHPELIITYIDHRAIKSVDVCRCL